MFRIFFGFLCIVFCLSANGQLITPYPKIEDPDLSLIPVKRDRLFGFVDHDNVLKIPAAYEGVSLFDKQGVALASEYGLYGMIDKSGRVVVPFISANKTIKREGPTYFYEGLDKKISVRRDNYFMVMNANSKKWFMFKQDDKGIKSSAVYSTKSSPVQARIPYYLSNKSERPDFYYGFKRVVKPTEGINFIDSTFKEMLSKDAFDGKAVSSTRFCLFNKEKQAFLADHKGTQVGDGLFYNIEFTPQSKIYKATSLSKVSYAQAVGLINDKGILVVDTIYKSLEYLHKDWFVAHNQNDMIGVINTKGEEVLPFEYKSLKLYSDKLYIGSRDSGQFIFDLKGNKVSGPYSSLKKHYSFPLALQFKNDTTTIVGDNGKELFRLPGNYNVNAQVEGGLILNKGSNQYYLYDHSGFRLISQELMRLTPTEVDGLMVAYHVDKKSKGLYSVKDKWALPMGDYTIKTVLKSEINKHPKITIGTKMERYIVTDTWKNKKVEELKPSKVSDYESRSDKTHKYITLASGTELSFPKEKKYRYKTNGEDIYFTLRDGNVNQLLDKNFNSIIPTGYILAKDINKTINSSLR